MEIIVCVKHVPETAGAEIVIDQTGKDIKKDNLVFDINDWDKYATEEALLLKEKLGGSVTAVTIGEESANDTLRRALAMGADSAIRIWDDAFEGSDGYVTARILSRIIKGMKFDLVLTGAQASDDGFGQVGPTLAQLLGIPHAVLVTKVEINDKKGRVRRELEGGLEEMVEIELPAAFSIQTGINEPRYVSIMGIRKAKKRGVKVVSLKDIGLNEEEVGKAGSLIELEELFLPPVGKTAEILEGNPDEVSARMANILKEKGGLG